ncbi:unnamed protein product [Chrysoparadoxa australica]
MPIPPRGAPLAAPPPSGVPVAAPPRGDPVPAQHRPPLAAPVAPSVYPQAAPAAAIKKRKADDKHNDRKLRRAQHGLEQCQGRAWVYKHFSQYAGGVYPELYVCNYCGSETKVGEKAKGSLANVKRHLRSCRPDLFEGQEPRPGAKQGKAAVNDAAFLEKMLKWMADMNIPVEMADAESFKDMIRTASVRGARVTNLPAIRASLGEVSASTKASVGKMLQGRHISLTANSWTSCAHKAYLLLKAHYIDDQWQLSSLTLDCQHFRGPHTGEAVATAVTNMVAQYGQGWAAVDVCVLDVAGGLPLHPKTAMLSCTWQTCMHHVLDRIADDGFLQRPRCKEALSRVKELAQRLQHSPVDQESLDTACTTLRIQGQVLQCEQSTFGGKFTRLQELLQKTRLQQQAILSMLSFEAMSPVRNFMPDDWAELEACELLLQPFKAFEQGLTSSQITLSLLPESIAMLQKSLAELACIAVAPQMVRDAAAAMLRDVVQRWGDVKANPFKCFPRQALLAELLDPRTKMLPSLDVFPHGLEEDRGALELRYYGLLLEEMANLVQEGQAVLDHPAMPQAGLSHVPDSHIGVAGQPPTGWVSDLGRPATAHPLQAAAVAQVAPAAPAGQHMALSTQAGVLQEELERFKKEPPLARRSGDPLSWWAAKARMFPVIANLAQRALQVPIFCGDNSVEGRALLQGPGTPDLLFLNGSLTQVELAAASATKVSSMQAGALQVQQAHPQVRAQAQAHAQAQAEAHVTGQAGVVVVASAPLAAAPIASAPMAAAPMAPAPVAPAPMHPPPPPPS